MNTSSHQDLEPKTLTAFDHFSIIATGPDTDVVAAVKRHFDSSPDISLLIFDDHSGEVVDVDFRGTIDEVTEIYRRRSQLAAPTAQLIESLKQPMVNTGPGRPRLGVVAREVTLLPRHWDWLNQQPGGASVAIRKLVEEARRDSAGRDRIRESQEKAYRFMSAIAGDLPKFEEALRALFAANADQFRERTAKWPDDVRAYAIRLSQDALAQ